MRAVLVVLLTCSCAPDFDGPAVRVTLTCIPDATTTIDARFVLDGGQAAPKHWERTSGFGSEESFDVFLPHGGELEITVTIASVDATKAVAVPASGSTETTLEFTGCPCSQPPAGCAAPFRCGATCFAFCPMMVTWPDALATCATWNGGCLAMPDRAASSCLGSHLSTQYASIDLRQDVAATDVAQGWAWSCTQTAPVDPAWAPFEPDDTITTLQEDHERDCSAVQSSDGRWVSVSCSYPVAGGFFCQAP